LKDTLTLDELKQLIISSLDLEGFTPDSIRDDQPLFGEGLGLDSVDALEIVAALEKRLGVRIRSDRIDARDLATVGNLHRFVEQQRAGSEGATG